MVNVLSLFDGMSGAQQAFDGAGIEVSNYYASEIDKNAIAVTQMNYPETIQLGSVTNLTDEYLLSLNIDVLIGGSPCTNLSFAGKQEGMVTDSNLEITTLEQYLSLKGNFTFKGASYLFWEYIRVLRLLEPKYFLLENTQMPKKWKNIFDETIGCRPIIINSSLLSAQNRKRLYWTNIPYSPIDDVLRLSVQDIELKNQDYPYFCIPKKSQKPLSQLSSECLCVAKADVKGLDQIKRVYSNQGKSPTLNTCQGGNREVKICDSSKERYRKLTPLECERLQTVKDDYTKFGAFPEIKEISKTQRYKMLGNGFTIDVIAHLLRGIINPSRGELIEW